MVKLRLRVTFTAMYEIYHELGSEEVQIIEEEFPSYDVCTTTQVTIFRTETMNINIKVEDEHDEMEWTRTAKRKVENILMNRKDRPSSELFEVNINGILLLKRY